MSRRMVDASIWANENFAELPPMARLLQIGIITLADDQGRLKANPAYLRSQVFPYDDVLLSDIEEWLDLMSRNETIQVYTVNGKTYLQLLRWWDYQSLSFAWASAHPRPIGWHDRLRFTRSGTTYTCNWISAKGDALPNTCDENGNPLSPSGAPHGNPHGAPSEPSNLTKLNLTTSSPYPLTDTETHMEAVAMAAVFDEYAENMPNAKITPVIRKELADLVGTYGDELVLWAITEAVTTGGKSIKYIRKTLENRANGIGPPGKNGANGDIPWQFSKPYEDT